MVALGNWFFQHRTTISPLLVVFLFLPGPKILPDSFHAALLGLLIAAAGQVIRATTIGFDYIVRGGRNHRVYAEGLVTEGLFRHVRNPMYVGKFFMVLGTGVATNRYWAALAITAAYTFMYHAVVLAEEAYLRRKFGAAFDEYCQRVPRWLPRCAGMRGTLSRSAFQWRRVVAKSYSEPLGWIVPIAGIGLLNLSTASESEPVARAFLIVVLAVGLTVWIVAGLLKRTRSALLRAKNDRV
jgi:protein-S-isoprenylcysteine O-methyltransferase Ste14